MNRSFNKKGLIENTIKGNIHYQKYNERIEIDMIGEQKWSNLGYVMASLP